MNDLTNLKTIKLLLNEYKIRVNKSLGQNFLLSKKTLNKIITAADLKPDDIVLEIGPGIGTLTLELAKKVKKVIAVEKDLKISRLFLDILTKRSIKNVQAINRDILKFSIFNFQFSNPKFQIQNSKFKIIANLPHQITSPVLWKFLHKEKLKPSSMILMLQKEVAERIVAKPGQMSLLSVLVQYYAVVGLTTNVKRNNFYPSPNVDSSVIRLRIKNHKSRIKVNEILFFKLIKAGFASKRKMLKNNLQKLGFSQNELLEAFKQAEIPKKARAQEITINNWIKLYKVVYNIDNAKCKV